MASLLTPLLILTACLLVGVICVMLFRYRRIAARRSIQLGREEVLGRLFLRKIKSLGDAGGEPAAMLKELSGLMRSFFSELFDISYEFDYVELNEELGRKGVDDAIRQNIIDYSMKTEAFQYGGRELTESDLSSIIQKSIIIVRSVTEKRQEGLTIQASKAAAEARMPEPEVPRPPKKPSGLSLAIEGFMKEPLPHKTVAEAKKPEEEAPGAREAARKAGEPVPRMEHAAAAPPQATERRPAIPSPAGSAPPRLRKLLLKAEGAISASNAGAAAEAYSELRGIYESLTQDEKRGMQDETRRIIGVYNALLSEYKSSLTASKKESGG